MSFRSSHYLGREESRPSERKKERTKIGGARAAPF
jgi:hypothetical protein